MKSRKLIVAVATVLFTISLLSSCHRSTCPTFDRGQADVRMDVRA